MKIQKHGFWIGRERIGWYVAVRKKADFELVCKAKSDRLSRAERPEYFNIASCDFKDAFGLSLDEGESPIKFFFRRCEAETQNAVELTVVHNHVFLWNQRNKFDWDGFPRNSFQRITGVYFEPSDGWVRLQLVREGEK